ncbi:hypothetical protein [Duganella phyllosphaerae]|uniref:Uncharacterized protein n=1 Tax=Duganella phyllosphaerae TaxID=762836 RepID=A0A1E7WR21_9BURK|nr:hypothetical protein [Duganella phyllosphaerae]OFA01893.1 hypothetical protein DUPY_21210 [Duganella phyllosphaerae]
MTDPVDFSHALPNPYFEKLSREITVRLDFRSIEYFQKLGEPYGLSAEEMMYRYLRHLAGSGYSADLGILTLDQRKQLEESLADETNTPADA